MADLDKAVTRGMRAHELLNDMLMVDARKHIDDELYRLFSEASPGDIEALRQIKSMQYMHAKYQAFLKLAVQDGKMARIEIERKKKTLKERILG